jgi:hypothetical protein
VETLLRFTGYSSEFISAIIFNLQNNNNGRYGYSAWLSPDGKISEREFWDHIAAACGELWLKEADPSVEIDTCEIYWKDRRKKGAPLRWYQIPS